MCRHREAIAICRILSEAGFPTMLAGGCVRDRLLGLRPADYDLATTATPEQAGDLLKAKHYKVVPTGLNHGTISLVLAGQLLEITTLRRDVVCDGRHAQVAYANDFAEDARRRDFTINALFEDEEGQIHDYVGGQNDLRGRVLRFVGEPGIRIREDYLRALRYFRFLARFGWSPHAPSLAAISTAAAGLHALSSERVQAELRQIMSAPHVASAWPLLAESGILTTLFDWYQPQTSADLAAMFAATPAACPELAWFSFLYWGSEGAVSSTQIGQRGARLRLARGCVRLLTQLAGLFENLNNLETALPALIRIFEKHEISHQAFLDWLAAAEQVKQIRLPAEISALIQGLARRDPPPIATPRLMEMAPRERGPAVVLAKICWYLGLCRDTNEVIGTLEQRDCFRKRLKAGKLI